MASTQEQLDVYFQIEIIVVSLDIALTIAYFVRNYELCEVTQGIINH